VSQPSTGATEQADIQRTDNQLEQQDASPRGEIEHPAALLRLAHMVQSTLNEVRGMDLDEAARDRLADVYNRTIRELTDAISEDLQEELSDVALVPLNDNPTAGELQIAQAQLVGWLQGLFQGIQASVASQQLAARQQAQRRPQPSAGPGGGQYL
jgi:hypothetical protein